MYGPHLLPVTGAGTGIVALVLANGIGLGVVAASLLVAGVTLVLFARLLLKERASDD